MNLKDIEAMRDRSGNVRINSRLVAFLYELMRDHLTPGIIEELMQNSKGKDDTSDCVYTNGWLAKYAEDVANRLKDK